MSARPAGNLHGYLIFIRQDPFRASTVWGKDFFLNPNPFCLKCRQGLNQYVTDMKCPCGDGNFYIPQTELAMRGSNGVGKGASKGLREGWSFILIKKKILGDTCSRLV